jgi:hypothetical protein
MGKGELTLERVCLLLEECPSTVIKLLKPRRKMRVKTAARILDKILTLLDRGDARLVDAPELELEDEFTDGERRQMTL